MYPLFLEIAGQLNHIGIIPLLMGSVGLEVRTGRSWQASDLDIHVPSDPRGWQVPDDQRLERREELIKLMENLGFVFMDPHEHAFQKQDLVVEFGGLHSLPRFAGIALTDLEEIQDQGVRYYLPSLSQFLNIYQASSKDSYRADKNNKKDFAKIAYLQERLKEENEQTEQTD